MSINWSTNNYYFRPEKKENTMNIKLHIKAEGTDMSYEGDMTEEEFKASCLATKEVAKYLPGIVKVAVKAFGLLK